VDDAKVRSILKKSIESLSILLEAKRGIGRDYHIEENSINLLQSFLPKEMGEEEVILFINSIIGEERGPKFIGKVVQAAKEQGLVLDNKMLSSLVKGSPTVKNGG
jgi:uncharacterized protein YqeY